MKKIFATILTTLFSLSLLFLSIPTPSNAVTTSKNLSGSFEEVKKVAGNDGAGYKVNNTSMIELIGSIIQIGLGLLGVVFLILTFYAGWIWMTAQGDSKKIDKSTDMLKSAIIGLIIVLFSYAISSFVMTRLTSKTLI